MATLDIERRVNLSISVGRYLRAADAFQKASDEFTKNCKSLREQLGPGQRFLVQVDYQHYLVTSDSESNFDVEAIESI